MSKTRPHPLYWSPAGRSKPAPTRVKPVPPCKRCGKTDSPQYAAHTDWAGTCLRCVDEIRAGGAP